MCHIGVWDHGSTGTKMEQFVKEFNLGPKERKALEKHTVMWEPHWTCCRGEWADPGTTNLNTIINVFKHHL